MKIAELFADLGIKGSEKTVGALTNVKRGLGDISSMSLEAKAAIVAAMYAFERLITASGQTGTGLSNFTALTGQSAQTLQQWQYAAQQAGVSAQEFQGNVKGIQNTMTELLTTGKGPWGMGLVGRAVGLDEKRVRDPFYVLGQLQKFAKSVPEDLGNKILKGFGLSEGVIAAMRKNVFRPDVFAKAPSYSDKEIQNLNRANIAWANLGQKIEMAFGHFNARHGVQLTHDIAQITSAFIKLADALDVVATKFKLFDTFGHILEGLANTVSLLSGNMPGGKTKGKETVPGLSESPIGQFFQSLWNREGIEEAAKKFSKSFNAPIDYSGHARPAVPAIPPSGKQQNIEINQNLNFQHEGRDHRKTGDSVKKAVEHAFRTNGAIGTGN